MDNEAREAYEDYLSTCVEKGVQPLSFDQWVAHFSAAPIPAEVDPEDDFPY